MSESRFRHLNTGTEQGVLVLTPSPARLVGDEMAQNLTNEMQSTVSQAAAKNVVVNLEHVEYLTSANFRPFLALRKQLLEVGGRMVLCNLSPSLRVIFEATRLVGSRGAARSFFPD